MTELDEVARQDATWTGVRLDTWEADKTTLAVKDCIDVEGTPTSLGRRELAATKQPALADATCVKLLRDAGCVVVGKTNLHEFCFGTTGINASFGTPRNPGWPSLIPGGSSSGSAVAVAAGTAEIGLGTDTAGSVRIPATCCGIVGLKLTNGAVPMTGVWPLSPELDALGLFSRSAQELPRWLNAWGIAEQSHSIRDVGVMRVPGVDPAISDLLETTLAAADVPFRVMAERVPWEVAARAAETILLRDAAKVIAVELEAVRVDVGTDIRIRLDRAGRLSAGRLAWAASFRESWRETARQLLTTVDAVALPVLKAAPPARTATRMSLNSLTSPVNLAGLPAISVPISRADDYPIGMQIVGRPGAEHALCELAQLVQVRALPLITQHHQSGGVRSSSGKQ